jgi:hypothetical protein
VPTPALGLNLHSQEFWATILYRLGLPLFPASSKCPSTSCYADMDTLGDHSAKGGRHDRLRDAIFNMASSTSYSPKKEMPNLIPGTQSRPADIFVPVWRDGRLTAFDVSVVSPVQVTLLDNAAIHQGTALNSHKTTKWRTHDNACRTQGISFVPLVVDVFGGWDHDAVVVLREMASCYSHRTGSDRSTTMHFFYHALLLAPFSGAAMRQCQPAHP